MKTVRSIVVIAAALAAAQVVTVAPALAQRDPAYQAARSAGQIGEQPDGYLGVVGAASPELRALVNNINIQRKAKYTQTAAAGATVEQMAFTSGCRLIAATVPGEKYKTPAGIWATRTAAPPERDSRCV
ncbi:YdbL family protein [Sphingomonas sp. NFR15]|uniref:YdbL family protein n=1 Tax=Sphingomonas sp. NFR15 TaxID=1566282 RepID=UPI0008803C8D|nr:YdbL family protein [Sphingomonas sp. NFR15]SDA13436.1 hypothetical protein SAMN03159340_00414 [Sphingomonas sp. NFR15]